MMGMVYFNGKENAPYVKPGTPRFIKIKIMEMGSPTYEVGELRVDKERIIAYKPITKKMFDSYRMGLIQSHYNRLCHSAFEEKNKGNPELERFMPVDDGEEWKQGSLEELNKKEKKQAEAKAHQIVKDYLPPNLEKANLVVLHGLNGDGIVEQMFTTTPIEELDRHLLQSELS